MVAPDNGPRLHAPVQTDARAFMDKMLYGNRHRRAPAATLAALRPSGATRGAAASNFATATGPSGPPADLFKKKKKKKAPEQQQPGTYSSLEKMAAAIMRKKRT